MPRILITGASGFIGSFLVERALDLGFEVWAGVRASSSRKWLQDGRIRFIDLPLGHAAQLQQSLAAFQQAEGAWDYVVHAAGSTKARSEAEFLRTNLEGTKHLADSLRELGMTPRRFVFLSSLSVLGAPREDRALQQDGHCYAPMTAADAPQPNTAYGRSKLAAERYLQGLPDFPLTILRPTGVYGPREKDYFLMAKSIGRHIDFAVGYRPQEITFIYVRDLVEAVFASIRNGLPGQTYLLSDGHTYSSRAFSDLLQAELGVRRVLHVRAPLWLLRTVCAAGSAWAGLTGRMTALNNDKFNILKQRNWRCDIQPALDMGYVPRYGLAEGVRETVAWYKQEKWI